MLDLRFVREHPDEVREAMRKKGEQADLDGLLALDARWRAVLQEVEGLKSRRNSASEEIGRLRKAGQDAGPAILAMQEVAARIKELDAERRELEERIEALLLTLPNIPDPDVPEGPGETANVEVRRWGEPPGPPGDGVRVPAHWDIGRELGILDFERAGKITGARFVVLRDDGARLARALVSFMLDLHVREHGYREISPPYLVNSQSMTGTGNLPKFAQDAFRVADHDLWLVPTAEVPVTNLHRDEILEASELPLRYVAYTPCFRSEAGAAGRDTRGLIRQHQFDKVELVKLVSAETSGAELESLTADAEAVLQRLGLPYRVLLMCTGDMGFAQAKKYDLEVWLPSYGRYVEISSCSNFRDFQARRARLRYRPAAGRRPEFVHTINGSGVAVGRALAAVLEHGWRPDGRVVLPEALRPYMNGQAELTATSRPARVGSSR